MCVSESVWIDTCDKMEVSKKLPKNTFSVDWPSNQHMSSIDVRVVTLSKNQGQTIK